MSSSILELVAKVDSAPYHQTSSSPKIYKFLSHDDVVIGKITEEACQHMRDVNWLLIDASTVKITTNEDLTGKFAELTSKWRSQKVFKCLEGWRNEKYICYTTGGKEYFRIERSAACIFGIVTYGSHITAYIPGEKKIWVPRRSYKKQTYPGMLDNTVAGGVGDGVSFIECAIKECSEEANIPPEYSETHLKQVGALSYEFIDPVTKFYQPEVECLYEMAVEPGFKPEVNDGEVHEFSLMSYSEVRERLYAGEFKYNSAVVIIDFLIRHDEIRIEDEPDYLEVLCRMHRYLEYPVIRLQ